MTKYDIGSWPILDYIGPGRFRNLLSGPFSFKKFCNKLDKLATKISYISFDSFALPSISTKQQRKNYILGISFELFIYLLYLSSRHFKAPFIVPLDYYLPLQGVDDCGIDALTYSNDSGLGAVQIKFRGNPKHVFDLSFDKLHNFINVAYKRSVNNLYLITNAFYSKSPDSCIQIINGTHIDLFISNNANEYQQFLLWLVDTYKTKR